MTQVVTATLMARGSGKERKRGLRKLFCAGVGCVASAVWVLPGYPYPSRDVLCCSHARLRVHESLARCVCSFPWRTRLGAGGRATVIVCPSDTIFGPSTFFLSLGSPTHHMSLSYSVVVAIVWFPTPQMMAGRKVTASAAHSIPDRHRVF